jgi:hypothetical protein
MILSQFFTRNHLCSYFYSITIYICDFHIDLGLLLCDSSSECEIVLSVILCSVVWILVLLRCSFDSYWKIVCSINDLCVNVETRRHEYFTYFNFIILFVDIFHCMLLTTCCEFIHIFLIYVFSDDEWPSGHTRKVNCY